MTEREMHDLPYPIPPMDNDTTGPSHESTRLEKLLQQYQATWDGPTDPRDPYNWPALRKFTIGSVISLGQLIAYMSANMIAPALDYVQRDIGTSAEGAQVIMLVAFLGFGFGPFAFAPMAEIYGRRPVWVVGNIWFIVWNALVPFGKSARVVVFARLMAGVGVGVDITLALPVMADLYREEERGKSMAVVSLLTYLGLALGPILGGLVTQVLRWQWIFWIISIFSTVVTIAGIIFLEETYTPVLLRRKHLSKTHPQLQTMSLGRKLQHSFKESHVHGKFGPTFLRPLRLYWTRPIIYLIASLLALDMGVYTLMLSSLATLWSHGYGVSPLHASLHYVAVAIGATINGQLGSYCMDRIYGALARRNGGRGRPEFRVPYLVPGLVLMPAGLLWYGWAAERRLHWAVVDVGVAVFTLGSFTTAQAVNAYQLGEFGELAASATAAACVVQNVVGFVLPIFAPKLYATLGYGLGNSAVAGGVVVVGLPLAAMLWCWGIKIRTWGKVEVRNEDREEVWGV